MAPVVDADSHVYEPTSIWDSYIASDERAMAKDAFWHEVDERGNRLTVLNGATAPDLNRSRIVRQAVWRPGLSPEAVGAFDPDAPPSLNPGAWDAATRLADMDALGIDQSIVYPTLFAEYLPMVANPHMAAVLARAY